MGLSFPVLNAGNVIHSNSSPRSTRGRAGQSLVEYALVLTFVSLVSILVMTFFSGQLNGVYATIIHALNTVRTAI